MSQGNEENAVEIHLTFGSPAEAEAIADALAEQGWEDIRLHVALDARATGSSEHLQKMHDAFKKLSRERLD